jgi:adenylate cyclase
VLKEIEIREKGWNAAAIWARLRTISGLTLLTFVVCHLAAHTLLLVSIYPVAQVTLLALMAPWSTIVGTAILASAALVHYSNALWSIYVRRSLRLPAWQWAQLALGLCIPPLLMIHVVSTRIAELMLGVHSFYSSVLVSYWVLLPWYAAIQAAAVLTVWVHACIGIHFWLRNKRWYPNLRPMFGIVALLLPTLALAGFISAGNSTRREAADNPAFVSSILENSELTQAKTAAIHRMEVVGWWLHVSLVLLTFTARGARAAVHRRRRLPMLTLPFGRSVPIAPGATVLETLRQHGIPHASVCGGRARCTTCRIKVNQGRDNVHSPQRLEAEALGRIGATPETRLACQVRPTADLSVTPLLPAAASAADGGIPGGLEGVERPITIVFVDLRGSTALAEAKFPYDVLFIFNRFFDEMTQALNATGGECAQFLGDGLMALYGLHAKDPALGPAQALRGAREMLARVEHLNRGLSMELPCPMRIGIGIHFSEAIVGLMGPSRWKAIGAVGDAVNTGARLERLTKEHNCSVVISRQATEAAGLDFRGHTLHESRVEGRTRTVQFYALHEVPDFV